MISLAQALNQLPNIEVVVSAPSENQSGSSHSSVGGPLTVKESKIEGIKEAYSVSGRPADAVRFALAHLGNDRSFDLVVSGINRGANVGDISHLSGTVGAAMEAVFQGVPAIAVSQEIRGVDTSNSAQFITRLVRQYMTDPIQEGTIISVNLLEIIRVLETIMNWLARMIMEKSMNALFVEKEETDFRIPTRIYYDNSSKI